MFRVGVKDGRWILITNGSEVYSSGEDVRHYSEPPSRARPPEDGHNRIFCLQLTPQELEEYARTNGFSLREPEPVGKATEVAEQMVNPNSVAGAMGAFMLGPVVAAFGSLLPKTEFRLEEMRKVFERVKSSFYKWHKYDQDRINYVRDKREETDKTARERWSRYHKIKNTSDVNSLSGIEFEVAVAAIYEKNGYQVTYTKSTGDFGVDLLASKGNEKLAIQAKRYAKNVGVRAVQEVSSGARHYNATEAIVITNSFFTDSAKVLAKSLNVRLINKKILANMMAGSVAEIPEFDINSYNLIKKDIDRFLWQLDKSAGRKNYGG